MGGPSRHVGMHAVVVHGMSAVLRSVFCGAAFRVAAPHRKMTFRARLQHDVDPVTQGLQFHISSSAGVGLYALQGLFSCGQFEISTITSISARSSTYLPGAEIPSSNVRPPAAVTGTFMKKLIFALMSRFDRRPSCAHARR